MAQTLTDLIQATLGQMTVQILALQAEKLALAEHAEALQAKVAALTVAKSEPAEAP